MAARKRAFNITWRQAWPIWLVFAVVFGIGAIGAWVAMPTTEMSTITLNPGQDLEIGPAQLPPDAPRFFTYRGEAGEKIEFFVERDAGDKVTVAFASCRKCFRSGHYRQDAEIFCGRCKQPMEQLAGGQSPTLGKDCTRVPIPLEKSGNHLFIRARAVTDAFSRWYLPVIAEDPTLGNHQ